MIFEFGDIECEVFMMLRGDGHMDRSFVGDEAMGARTSIGHSKADNMRQGLSGDLVLGYKVGINERLLRSGVNERFDSSRSLR